MTGGKTKAAYHWAICVTLFKNHPDYHTPFSMSEITCKYMDEMGETGAGITREDEINMDVKNSFTTKWGVYLYDNQLPTVQHFFMPAIIKEACPWFFDMWEIIAERPNQVPVGLGPVRWTMTSPNPIALAMSGERQGKSSVTGLKTSPQPGMSKPATTKAPKNPVKRRKKDEFAKIAQAEEVTRQKELEVAKLAKLELEKEKVGLCKGAVTREDENVPYYYGRNEPTSWIPRIQHAQYLSQSFEQFSPTLAISTNFCILSDTLITCR
ncbi:uncharacterized protein F5147DRAFT_661003 [Suillus discolor]|uniref:Uncharacterized protein n=1 Tax=Suillus discolor TaxID=1912936 RepID=A0A9P7ERF7_9AGAM|nr:uncharacterized protein F5147DRAFT_661003 [Suillus discolor]KAG2081072.1 hypothetical protein F5147DRAFT_661003 [Suillus discolor]